MGNIKEGAVGRQLKGNLFILITTIFFGVNLPVVKMLIPQWMTSMDVSAFRMFGGCALMWLVSLFMKNDRIQKKHRSNIILGGAVGLFFFIFLFNLSIRFSNPIDVAIIMTLPPAFVVLINAIFKGNRPSGLEIAGMVMSFIGAFIVISMEKHGGDRGSFEILGDILALASALCYAFYLVILEEPMKEYKPVSLLRWVYLVASIPAIFLIPGLCHAPLWHTTAAEPWLLIGFVVLCPTFLAYFLMAPAMKLLSSELVSIYQYLVPVVASISSVMLKVADINVVEVIAMIVIIGGMAISNVGKFRRNKRHIAALKAHGIEDPASFISDIRPAIATAHEKATNISKAAAKLREFSSDEMLSAPQLSAWSQRIINDASDLTQAAQSIKEKSDTN